MDRFICFFQRADGKGTRGVTRSATTLKLYAAQYSPVTWPVTWRKATWWNATALLDAVTERDRTQTRAIRAARWMQCERAK